MEWDELYSFNNAAHAYAYAYVKAAQFYIHNVVFRSYLINGKGGG